MQRTAEKTPLARPADLFTPGRVRPKMRRSRAGRSAAPAASVVVAGRTLLRGRLSPIEVGIDDDGWIVSVARSTSGARRVDFGEGVIVPAATDLHVHFREPGGDAESIATGTVEAALGGIAAVGEMPNTVPVIDRVDRLEEKAARVRGRAAVDVLLYGTPTGRADLGDLAGAVGAMKVFMSPTSGIERVPGPRELPAWLEALRPYDLPITVHAEEPTEFRDGPPAVDPSGWDSSRPPRAERAALARLGAASPYLRLHIAHVTLAESVAALRGAGRSFEATPHHLLLSDRSGRDARFKVNPPLRPERERAALWAAFARGEVPCLASDHAPHSAAAKEGPFDTAPSGMAGVETMVPLMLARVRAAELSLDVLQRSACDRPARWFGQPLGRIAPGHRASFMVVDFRRRIRVDGRRLHAPCGWSAFDGHEAIFPRELWRNGVPIARDGEFIGRRDGTVVAPEFSAAARRRAGRPDLSK